MEVFPRLALSRWLSLIKGAKFSPSQNFIHAHSTAQGKENEDGLFFLVQSHFFFIFLAYDASLWLCSFIPSGKMFFVKSVSVVYTLKSGLPNVELQILALWSLWHKRHNVIKTLHWGTQRTHVNQPNEN